MKLFNKYQSRTFQFALELMARLEREDALEEKEVQKTARERGLDYAGQVLEPLYRAGILEREGRGCRLSGDLSFPRLPAGHAERAYLKKILRMPESELFLEEPLREKLVDVSEEAEDFADIQDYAPAGEPLPARPGPEGFRVLLSAIHQRFLIQYTYRTRDDDTPRSSVTLPWKLEYSAYDRRWWVILYDSGKKRTIKARLDHLENIQLAGPAEASEEEIEAAMDRLMEPDPVVLRIRRTRGALERCFLVFENQMFEETSQESEDCYRMSFRYYRFDRTEILRRLLYLGPAVTLLGPESLRAELAKLLDAALNK